MLPTSGYKRPELCEHKFGDPERYTKIHSEIACTLCGYEKIIPTPEYMKPDPNWNDFIEVV